MNEYDEVLNEIDIFCSPDTINKVKILVEKHNAIAEILNEQGIGVGFEIEQFRKIKEIVEAE